MSAIKLALYLESHRRHRLENRLTGVAKDRHKARVGTVARHDGGTARQFDTPLARMRVKTTAPFFIDQIAHKTPRLRAFTLDAPRVSGRLNTVFDLDGVELTNKGVWRNPPPCSQSYCSSLPRMAARATPPFPANPTKTGGFQRLWPSR